MNAAFLVKSMLGQGEIVHHRASGFSYYDYVLSCLIFVVAPPTIQLHPDCAPYCAPDSAPDCVETPPWLRPDCAPNCDIWHEGWCHEMSTYSNLTKQVGRDPTGDRQSLHCARDQPPHHVPQRLRQLHERIWTWNLDWHRGKDRPLLYVFSRNIHASDIFFSILTS